MEEEIWTWMRYNGKLYEGEFQVSNLGGIRSVDRYVDCHGKYGDYKQFTKGHPLSTFVASQYLHTQIYEHGKGKHILIHRAVLESFVPNPDPKIYTDVNHKNENKLNNRLDNLEWCTKYYNDNYGTARERANKSISIPIVQLNLDGSFVKEWQSATKAEEAGFGCATIINRCIKKKLKSHYGYLWLYSDEYNKMSKEELNEYIKWTETITYKKDKRVVQLNMDGSLVKIWNQVSDVSKKDMSVTTISNCINRKYKNAYGYIWFRYLEYINFSDSELKEKVEYANIDTQKIPVVQLSMDDKLIKVWDSAKDAAKDNDFCASTISAVCKHKNGRTQHKGYKWMYLSDYERIK